MGNVQDRKPIRGSLVWWLRVFGILAFVVILLRLPKSQNLQLSHIDLRWLGWCMFLTVVQLLLDVFVWHWLLLTQRIRYPYPKTLVTYLASQYLGLVTPGHVGEFLAAGYISMDTGITFGYALSSVVMKKLLTWTIVASFGLWGLPLLAQVPLLQGVNRGVLVGVAVLVILAVAIAIWVVSLRRLAGKWQKLSPWKIEMTEFWSGMRGLVRPALLVAFGAGALAFGLIFLQVGAILRALGIGLPMLLVARIVALSRIFARIAPVSVVGFGSKDAVMILLFAQQGIDPSVGLTVSLLFLVCSYLITLLASGLCWWVKPLVVRRVAPSSS